MKTKEKLLNHTKHLITHCGVNAVSGRKICRDLGLNISSISYHFGDKETLIKAALQELTYETLSFSNILFSNDLPLRDSLIQFFMKMLKEVKTKPDIARHILMGKSKYPSDNIMQNEVLIHLLGKLENEGIHFTSDLLRMRFLQVISAIAYPAELGIFDDFTDRMSSDYVKSLVNQLLLKE